MSTHLARGEGQDGNAFQAMAEGSAPAAALAVVAHFDLAQQTKEAKEWGRCLKPFDWTLQDSLGAEDPERRPVGLATPRGSSNLWPCVSV